MKILNNNYILTLYNFSSTIKNVVDMYSNTAAVLKFLDDSQDIRRLAEYS